MLSVLNRHEETPIPQDNIWKDDVTGYLSSYAGFLSNSLNTNLNSFVMCVDSPWGGGKTFFVRRWAEQLKKDGKLVVEFNAWKNDTESDPLLPLVAVLTKTLCGNDKKNTLGNNLKKLCGKIAINTGGLLIQATINRFLGGEDDKFYKKMLTLFNKKSTKLFEEMVDSYIERENTRNDFRNELQNIIEQQEDRLPCFIFIDELDRCRPKFAVELLERIKHLFDVDGLKFVISADTQQLACSIRGAYGHEFDGTTYLQRFFDQTFSLPAPTTEQFSSLLFKDIHLNSYHHGEMICCYNDSKLDFAELSEVFGLTLRQQQQVFKRLLATLPGISGKEIHFDYLVFLIMLRLRFPEEYQRIIGMCTALQKDKTGFKIELPLRNSRNSFKMSIKYLYYLSCEKEVAKIEANKDRVPLGQPVRELSFDESFDRILHKKAILSKIWRDYETLRTKYPQYVEMATHIDVPAPK